MRRSRVRFSEAAPQVWPDHVGHFRHDLHLDGLADSLDIDFLEAPVDSVLTEHESQEVSDLAGENQERGRVRERRTSATSAVLRAAAIAPTCTDACPGGAVPLSALLVRCGLWLLLFATHRSQYFGTRGGGV